MHDNFAMQSGNGSVQLRSVRFNLITQECCISSVVEVFMQVLGPINKFSDDIITELAGTTWAKH